MPFIHTENKYKKIIFLYLREDKPELLSFYSLSLAKYRKLYKIRIVWKKVISKFITIKNWKEVTKHLNGRNTI